MFANINTYLRLLKFGNPNQANQMLMDANAKFCLMKTSAFFHFCVILNECPHVWKYASFEGGEIVLTP